MLFITSTCFSNFDTSLNLIAKGSTKLSILFTNGIHKQCDPNKQSSSNIYHAPLDLPKGLKHSEFDSAQTHPSLPIPLVHVSYIPQQYLQPNYPM